jgi:hypothetical protein
LNNKIVKNVHLQIVVDDAVDADAFDEVALALAVEEVAVGVLLARLTVGHRLVYNQKTTLLPMLLFFLRGSL